MTLARIALFIALTPLASAQFVLTNQDDCSNAGLDFIIGPGAVTVDATAATTGAEGQNELNCLEAGQTGITNDIWFLYTPSTTGTAIFGACGTGPLTGGKIAVWPLNDSCPMDGTSLGCDAIGCLSQGGGAVVEVPVTFGATYQVQVGSQPGNPPWAGLMVIAEFIGTNYCSPATPNSTGVPAEIFAVGDGRVATNFVNLTAINLPLGEFGYFLTSRSAGLSQPPGSQGTLCLSGNVGRWNQDIITGGFGQLLIDLGEMPVNPVAAVMPGETWNFQCWYRDGTNNNFSDALAVQFQ